MSYMTISSQEKHNFSLCSCFHAHPTTLLLKILGGDQCMGGPPTSNFGGTVPHSPPLGLRPCQCRRIPRKINFRFQGFGEICWTSSRTLIIHKEKAAPTNCKINY